MQIIRLQMNGNVVAICQPHTIMLDENDGVIGKACRNMRLVPQPLVDQHPGGRTCLTQSVTSRPR